MHTGHLILIKADDHEDAIARVGWVFAPDEGVSPADNWSDWFAIGADSRWDFPTELEEGEEWDGASHYAVSLDDEADLFQRMLNKFYGLREAAFDRVSREVQDDVMPYRLDQNDEHSWKLYRFAQLAESIYCRESFVYDAQNYTADLKYFREDTAADGKGWYAVLVDFHF